MELTALDLHYLVKELQYLKDSKVDQIYHSGDILIRLHTPGKGKSILRISDRCMYVSDFKEEMSEPTGFAMALRKHLRNARLRKIEQVNSERVVKFVFEKQKKMFLFAEFFGKGKTILTDEDLNIIIGKGKYDIPEKEFNFLEMKESQFKKMLKESSDNLVKTLARKLGLGGVYAEYVLEDFDKKKKASELKSKEASKIFDELKKIRRKRINPSMLGKKLVPFKTDNPLEFESYSKALSSFLTEDLIEEVKEKKLEPYRKKKAKYQKIIDMQKSSIKKFKKEIKESSEKAEAIYNNYNIINEILETLKTASKKYSWKEIKDKVKGNKYIKQINEKDGKVLIEI